MKYFEKDLSDNTVKEIVSFEESGIREGTGHMVGHWMRDEKMSYLNWESGIFPVQVYVQDEAGRSVHPPREINVGGFSKTISDDDPHFDLAYGTSYCELGNSNSSSQHCSTCAAGRSHDYDELNDAGVSQEKTIYADGRLWKGKEVSSNGSMTFGWNETVYRFCPVIEDPFNDADLGVIRRRIEDRLRKDDEAVKRIAVLLGVKLG
jgi:hypothetical protein